MIDTPEYNRNIEEATQLDNIALKEVEKQFGFTYRQGIGELLYAMIACRPDISFPLIKLSQYSTRPALIHFKAVQQLYKYLEQTPTEGIYYWRK